MARLPRGEVIKKDESGLYHCWTNTVRSLKILAAEYRGKSRRDWVIDRAEDLARWFGISIAFYSVLDNHYHFVLQTLPELVKKWTDKQVIKRSSKIYAWKFLRMGVRGGEATPEQLEEFARDKELVAECRARLSDPSWFMKQLNQYIAWRCNQSDEKRGHFVGSRFGCRALLDDVGILIAGIYVDLNEIRAQLASTLEEAKRSSVSRRLQALRIRRDAKAGEASDQSAADRRKAAQLDGFLSPLCTTGDGQTSEFGYLPAGCDGSRRATDVGVLDLTLENYLQILEWVGRQPHEGKRGQIDSDAPSALASFGLSGSDLMYYLANFERRSAYAAGRASAVSRFLSDIRGRIDPCVVS